MLEENRRIKKLLRELPQGPKRRSKSEGIDGWYPYYAGFSSTFAHGILSHLDLRKSDCILDPWNGSGTTTYVAHSLGLPAIGIDLNPFATLVARAKLARFESSAALSGLIAKIVSSAQPSITNLRTDDPLLNWLSSSAAKHLRSLERAIYNPDATPNSAPKRPLSVSPQTAFFLLCLIRAGKQLATIRGSNPTWTKPAKNEQLTGSRLRAAFSRLSHALGQEAINAQRNTKCRIRIDTGDSRALPIADSSVSAVLTSPPYCTRIDYAVTSHFELAVLGVSDDSPQFTQLRNAMMGTTTIRNIKSPEVPKAWAPSVQRLLSRIRNHSSQASSRYYYKNIWQYFDDAHKSLSEISRVLMPQGVGFLVLQTSFYKDINIDLPRLFVEMANTVSLSAEVAHKFPVLRVMTNVNSSARRYLKDRSYFESVVIIRKPQ